MGQVLSGGSEAAHRRYVIAVLSGMRGACIECVCVVPPAGGFPVPGVRPRKLGCVLFPLHVRGLGFGDGG